MGWWMHIFKHSTCYSSYSLKRGRFCYAFSCQFMIQHQVLLGTVCVFVCVVLEEGDDLECYEYKSTCTIHEKTNYYLILRKGMNGLDTQPTICHFDI